MKVRLVYCNVSRVAEEASVHLALQASWYFCSDISILQEWYLFQYNVINTVVIVCLSFA